MSEHSLKIQVMKIEIFARIKNNRSFVSQTDTLNVDAR